MVLSNSGGGGTFFSVGSECGFVMDPKLMEKLNPSLVVGLSESLKGDRNSSPVSVWIDGFLDPKLYQVSVHNPFYGSSMFYHSRGLLEEGQRKQMLSQKVEKLKAKEKGLLPKGQSVFKIELPLMSTAINPQAIIGQADKKFNSKNIKASTFTLCFLNKSDAEQELNRFKDVIRTSSDLKIIQRNLPRKNSYRSKIGRVFMRLKDKILKRRARVNPLPLEMAAIRNYLIV